MNTLAYSLSAHQFHNTISILKSHTGSTLILRSSILSSSTWQWDSCRHRSFTQTPNTKHRTSILEQSTCELITSLIQTLSWRDWITWHDKWLTPFPKHLLLITFVYRFSVFIRSRIFLASDSSWGSVIVRNGMEARYLDDVGVGVELDGTARSAAYSFPPWFCWALVWQCDVESTPRRRAWCMYLQMMKPQAHTDLKMSPQHDIALRQVEIWARLRSFCMLWCRIQTHLKQPLAHMKI